MNKQRIFAFTLVLVLASAVLALSYQQTPQRPGQSLDAQAMQERILKLEEKVAQLDKQIQATQKQLRVPRIELLQKRDE